DICGESFDLRFEEPRTPHRGHWRLKLPRVRHADANDRHEFGLEVRTRRVEPDPLVVEEARAKAPTRSRSAMAHSASGIALKEPAPLRDHFRCRSKGGTRTARISGSRGGCTGCRDDQRK